MLKMSARSLFLKMVCGLQEMTRMHSPQVRIPGSGRDGMCHMPWFSATKPMSLRCWTSVQAKPM